MIRRILLPFLLVGTAFAGETPGEAAAPAAPPVQPGAGAAAGTDGALTASAAMKSVRERCAYVPAEYAATVGEPHSFGEGLLVERVDFPSPVKSVDPERNDVVRAKLFRRPDPEPAAVSCLGGWRFDPLTPLLGARLAEETGVQALFLDLPFQGERTPKGKMPGELTFSADVDQNLETFVQAAQDVGRAVDWLVRERKVDPKRIGVLGTSLGGFVAADLYGLDDRFACAVIQIAGADVAGSVFNGNRITRGLREALVARGVDEATFGERMRPMAPATWSRKERKDGLLLIAAEKDEVVPLTSVRQLADAYGGAETVVMPGVGHVSPEALKEHFARAVEHVRKCLALPEAKAVDSPAPAEPVPAGK